MGTPPGNFLGTVTLHGQFLGSFIKHRTPGVQLLGAFQIDMECPWYSYDLGRSYEHRTPMVLVQLWFGVVRIETEHPSTVSIGSFGDERRTPVDT